MVFVSPARGCCWIRRRIRRISDPVFPSWLQGRSGNGGISCRWMYSVCSVLLEIGELRSGREGPSPNLVAGELDTPPPSSSSSARQADWHYYSISRAHRHLALGWAPWIVPGALSRLTGFCLDLDGVVMSKRSAALAEEFSSSFMSGSRTPLTDSVPDYLAQATVIAPMQQNCSHPPAFSPYSHTLSGLLLCYSFWTNCHSSTLLLSTKANFLRHRPWQGS